MQKKKQEITQEIAQRNKKFPTKCYDFGVITMDKTFSKQFMGRNIYTCSFEGLLIRKRNKVR